jgi:hypothetical protein
MISSTKVPVRHSAQFQIQLWSETLSELGEKSIAA